MLLSVHGDVKLGDFGIAKAAVARSLPGVSGRAKGKLGYLAPEQVTGVGHARHRRLRGSYADRRPSS
ncbi:MAG: hypothetical protein R3B99_12420 [Polyangiales bacterium]